MRVWIFRRAAVVWCLSLATTALAEECASNPCLHAVTATASSQKNATADCISFFAIEPETRTVTKTVTANSTTPRLPAKTNKTTKSSGQSSENRESEYQPFDNLQYGQALEESKQIPEYASECTAATDYSSACSCLGVSTPPTSSRSTMTVIATVTVTAFNGNGTAPFGNSTAPFRNTTSASSPTARILHAGKSSAKPPSKSSGKQGKAAGKSTGKATGKVTGKTTGKTAGKATGKWTGKSTGKSTGKTTSKTSSSVALPGVGQQGSSTIGSSSGLPTVYVVNATTTVITSSQRWANTSLPSSLHTNSTGRYWNSTASSTANLTSTINSLHTSNATHWLNASSTHLPLTNTTHPIWLNTSLPTFTPNTTVRWPNTTTLPNLNQTASVRWPNTTSLPHLNSTTSVRWPNSTLRASNTSTPTTTPTPLPYPTTCGEDTPPFHLQLSFPDSPFNDWFVSLVGNNLLFTRNLTASSTFSVEPSGHLCVVGYVDSDGIPAVGSVERRVGVGVVYLLRKRTVEGLEGDYGVLSCAREGGGVECEVRSGEGAGGRSWVGCGIQLGLGKKGEEESDERCRRVGVRVVDAGGGG
ncbi:hypothetical protein QBC34DRAFT_443124 [Podospora aff. communis PSN243]|uniref:Uncharacterized protein n=1 Tax=Podospora aff. communis PSN243 TaxID=3040156 RepID=A0AAV9G8C1_9PEZI|nr:hypothetical protein QBC34DRAFT_443124 [Podospora aff. communis PSN243]